MAISIETKRHFIQSQAAFANLNPDEADILVSLLKEKYFSAGDTIVMEGDPVDNIFLIISGTANVCHLRIDDGKLVTHSLATLGPNQTIGLSETGFYSLTGMRTATVIALTDMEMLQLSVAAIHGFALAYTHVSDVLRKNQAKITPDMNDDWKI